MTIRFIIGRAGSGKSRRCLDEIRERLIREPDGHQLLFLVPEQATFQAEHALVSTPGLGGMIRSQVLSFRRLAWRVMQETGNTTGLPMDETGKAMLLQRILHKHNDRLKVFHSSAEKMGFINNLNTLFSELKRYGVTAGSLEAHLSKHSIFEGRPLMIGDKLQDLLLVYRDFEQELASKYLDGEDYLTHLSKQLQHCAAVCEADVWIDGFFGFTPQELAAVAECMKCCRSVTVTLCLDRPYSFGERPQELDLFHPTAMTMIHLQEQIQALGLPAAEIVRLSDAELPRYAESPMLAHLEANYEHRLSPRKKLFEGGASNQSGVASKHIDIAIHAAVNRRAEVEGAAREMLHLVREKEVRWRDLAVRVRNIQEYGDLLATVFSDYGIPYFFDQKRTVLHHPLVEFIRSALEVVSGNWRYDAVFRCVKTDFLLSWDPDNGATNRESLQEAKANLDDSRLHYIVDRHAMDELENYVLSYGIQGYRWMDERSWGLQRQISLEDGTETNKGQDPLFEQRIRQSSQAVVKPLSAIQKKLAAAANVTEMTEALYQLLRDTHVPERLEQWGADCILAGNPEKAREHTQVWDRVMDVLDQLVEIMGAEKVSLDLFTQVLDAGLESISLGLVPPSLDQVLIGSIDRTRSTQIKYCFVLGVNDGVLPQRMSEDSILAENEREWLLNSGLPLADGSRRKLLDEQFLIYSVVCAPSKHLWLSYPLADEEGKSLLPSELIKQLKSMFPQIEQRMLMAEPDGVMALAQQVSFVAHPERTLSYLTVQIKQWTRGQEIAPLWWETYNWYASYPKWRDKLRNMMRALLFTNEERALSTTTSRQLYGPHLKASVSRMERFVACPFSHFAAHGLKLRERRVYRLEAPDIGQLFHAALSELVRQLQLEQVELSSLNLEQLYERSSAIVDLLAPRLLSEILLSSSRYRYIARKLKDIIGRASVMLAEHARRGVFVPIGLELGFGPGETLPSLAYTLDNGFSMDIVGRIDRVDRADNEQGTLLRIVDYKSSQTNLNLAELYYGLSLQMLTYLDVVLTHAEQWLGVKATPAGVLYFHVHNPLIQKENAISAEAVEAELRKRFKMKGLLRADAETIRMMDNHMIGRNGYSELVPAAIKADGSFYKNASVASEQQWNGLRNYVRQVTRTIGTEITNGNVSIEPYRLGKKIACTFCSYKPVCQFDPLCEGNHYHALETIGKEDVLQEMEAGIGMLTAASLEGKIHIANGFTAQQIAAGQAGSLHSTKERGGDDGVAFNETGP